MITILDYGMGNLGSVQNMFQYIGVKSEVTNDIEKVRRASRILLPGVGAFDAAMKRINENGFKEVLKEKAVVEKVPFLGICLGMQLLTEGSDEGNLKGLGFIPSYTHKFQVSEGFKVPHMGWNEVYPSQDSALTKGLEGLAENEPSRFYFVHSYYVKVRHEENSILKTQYIISFDSGIQLDNIMGCQFHPEKSHKFGMKLLENFSKI